MNICFLDTESYLLSLQEAQEDPEYAQQLKDISGYNVFVATLDQFMDRKGPCQEKFAKLFRYRVDCQRWQLALFSCLPFLDLNDRSSREVKSRSPVGPCAAA